MALTCFFDCYSGASGDMLLASLLDKLVDFNWFIKELQKLNIESNLFNIQRRYVDRSSINSCKIDIKLNKKDSTHRSYKTIVDIIDNSSIKPEAKELSKNIFLELGQAEASVHNKNLEEIHFHEVGSLDSIIDIVGFSLCYTELNIETSIVSPIPVGSGKITCQHGTLPIPTPATLEILKKHSIRIKQNKNIEGECLTPTAAAILCTIYDECSEIPDFKKINTVSYGAGDKVFSKEVVSNLRLITGNL